MEVVMRSFSREKNEIAKDVYNLYNKTTIQFKFGISNVHSKPLYVTDY